MFLAIAIASTLATVSFAEVHGLDSESGQELRAEPVCDPIAAVGSCLGVGCFWDHGKAHCEGTSCQCDSGHCSYDGWTCVPTPVRVKAHTNTSSSTKTRTATSTRTQTHTMTTSRTSTSSVTRTTTVSSTTRTRTHTTTTSRTSTSSVTRTTTVTSTTPTTTTSSSSTSSVTRTTTATSTTSTLTHTTTGTTSSTSSSSTLTSSTSTNTTTTTLAFYPHAVVGSCLGVGCFMRHGHAHCGGYSNTQCICDEGYCSHDLWTCVPCPQTAMLTSINTTHKPWIPNAVVGGCFLAGCFWNHGNAHCGGWARTQCICDEGSCSRDGWHCERCPSDVMADQMLVEEGHSKAASYLHSTVGAGLVITFLVTTIVVFRRRFVPQRLAQEDYYLSLNPA